MTGIELIAAERQRQIEVEGWTPEHDDQHMEGELAEAASAYALPERSSPDNAGFTYSNQRFRKIFFPWPNWWKPTPEDRVRELVKAGALIAAEIDRLQRKSPTNV